MAITTSLIATPFASGRLMRRTGQQYKEEGQIEYG
jgi:hypothetical protein